MPLLKLQVAPAVPEDKKNNLMTASSRILADATGKPENYVMVALEEASFCMAAKVGPAAFVDVRGIGGLDRDTNARISKGMCDLLKKELNIPTDRIYLNFTDVQAQNWGWKGATFG